MGKFPTPGAPALGVFALVDHRQASFYGESMSCVINGPFVARERRFEVFAQMRVGANVASEASERRRQRKVFCGERVAGWLAQRCGSPTAVRCGGEMRRSNLSKLTLKQIAGGVVDLVLFRSFGSRPENVFRVPSS